jgi:beta-lactamase class A
VRRRGGAAAAVLASLVLAGCSGTAERSGAGPGATGAPADPQPATCVWDDGLLADRLGQLERRRDALVGVYAVETGTGAELAYRADARFALASTVKALAAAVVLDRLSERELSQRVRWTEADLVPYSPVTERHVEDGLTVRQVLEAAVTVSDNTAGNLLLDLVGGPRALDAALASLGDDVTEVVRREPELNDFTPGDRRDTTTPRALASALAAFAVGDALRPRDRRSLLGLLERTTTGDDLIRSAVPPGWRVGDKTGSARYGTRNDVAVVRPPGRPPLVLAVLTRHDRVDAPTDDSLVARAAAAVLGGCAA